jgi:type IV secretion system protein VirB2
MIRFAHLAFVSALLVPMLANAQVVGGGSDPSTILQAIVTWITGPFGQSVAVLALIGAGLAFFFGRFGIFHLVSIVGGLVLVFGASYLVQQFLGG